MTTSSPIYINISPTRAIFSDNSTISTFNDYGLATLNAINIALIVITVWVLLCLIIYGTKSGRWTKTAQSSSLNSGRIYTVCTIAVAMSLPRLITSRIMFSHDGFDTELCEILGDVAAFGYGFSLYGTYTFLWLRQRLTYVHPYVKTKVGKCMNQFSRLFLVILTLVTVGLICFFIVPHTYYRSAKGCIEIRTATSSYILGVVFVLTQSMLLCLCIYPACRVTIKTFNDDANEKPNVVKQNEEVIVEKRGHLARCCMFLSGVVTSPVEMTIKRTIVCSILIVMTDLIAVIIDAAVLPQVVPAVVHQTVADISSCVNIFLIIGTFGHAFRVLTFCIPPCHKWRAKEKVENGTPSVCETTDEAQV